MLWQILEMQGWLVGARGINALFVLVCLAAALGANTRTVALVSAALYLLLVLAG